MAENELFGNSEQLNDTISRQAAIDAVYRSYDTILDFRSDGETVANSVEDILSELPSAQPSATDTNVATTDTISRAAVVDEIEGVDWYHINKNGEMVHGANSAEHQAWYKADDIYAAIERVPSAQPVAKDINVPVKDCISRQAALGALGERPVVWSDNDDYTLGARNQYDMDRLALETVPSAQQWIPCSERLPKVREWVLCQCRAGIMDVLRLTEDGSWDKNYPHAEYMSGFVIAWCPLPEPWKGDTP